MAKRKAAPKPAKAKTPKPAPEAVPVSDTRGPVMLSAAASLGRQMALLKTAEARIATGAVPPSLGPVIRELAALQTVLQRHGA